MAEGIEVYAVFLERFETRGLDYFVTGSVASSAYGEPRFTQDIELVVRLAVDEVEALVRGFPVEEFYVPPTAALREEVARAEGGHFNLIHHESGVRADVYIAATDPLVHWAMGRRRRIELSPELSLWLAPPEYVILRKLEWLREGGGDRHEHDVRRMIAAVGEQLDPAFLETEIANRKLIEFWHRVREPRS